MERVSRLLRPKYWEITLRRLSEPVLQFATHLQISLSVVVTEDVGEGLGEVSAVVGLVDRSSCVSMSVLSVSGAVSVAAVLDDVGEAASLLAAVEKCKAWTLVIVAADFEDLPEVGVVAWLAFDISTSMASAAGCVVF